MNTAADRTLRAISFETARQTLRRALLSVGEITEEEYTKIVDHLAEHYGIDPITGLDRPKTPPAPKKEPVDERFFTYANLSKVAKRESDSPATAIVTWLRSHKTFEFLREWEKHNNPDFNENGYKELMASDNKTITPKLWCEKTNAIGIVSRQGNNGGTFAHHIIAADFMMWNSAPLRYVMIRTLANGKKSEESELAEH